jgi:hypothetical protein
MNGMDAGAYPEDRCRLDHDIMLVPVSQATVHGTHLGSTATGQIWLVRKKRYSHSYTTEP